MIGRKGKGSGGDNFSVLAVSLKQRQWRRKSLREKLELLEAIDICVSVRQYPQEPRINQ